LSGDEAEYWTWSRKLDWSYFTRGPLIAVLIRAGTAVSGGLSVAVSGSLMPAVRLPAVLLGALTGWGVYRLTRETAYNPAAALFAVLLLPAMPLFRAGALIITSDTPLICCWVWAAVWCHRAIRRDSTFAWFTAGAIAGLGVAAKYTMLAFPASVGLFLLLDSSRRRYLLRPGFWLMSALCVLGAVPIVFWNATHGWVGADQMAHRVGLLPSDMVVQPPADPALAAKPNPVLSLLTFLGSEPAVLGPWWIVGYAAIATAIARLLRSRNNKESTASRTPPPIHIERTSGLLYLLSLWVVVWSACFAVSLMGENEANWAAPAHASVACLAGWWISTAWTRVLMRRVLVATWVFCMALLFALQHTEWLYPALVNVIPRPSPTQVVPLRLLDPTCRMRGYAELAREVHARWLMLKAQGHDPFILTPTYTLAASLSFYLPGQPEVYCLSWSPGFPVRAVNQHDMWRPNPRFDIDDFRGRPAIVVAETKPGLNYARKLASNTVFRHAFPTEHVSAERSGLPVGMWDISICADFQGLPSARERAFKTTGLTKR
jgi:4-amino-4-deoxy-L-arabinose transferase-like glycosyltransferase